MARRQSRVMSDGEEPQLDMTPMLDVVFILLIFFIVTAVFVKEPGADIIRPETVTQDRVKPTLLVAVTSNDEIFVDGDVYELNQLRNIFEQLREENPRAEAMIQGDEGAPAGTVLDVQELLLDMGIDVTISTRED